ncbi:hypothetical protein BC567DRAFT_265377 [Phyllosticta citribraziliensis]
MKHDWLSPEEATLRRSEFFSLGAAGSGRAQKRDIQHGQPKDLWSRVVSPSQDSSDAIKVRGYDLQEHNARYIWTASGYIRHPSVPLYKDPRHQPSFAMFKRMATDGHYLQYLKVNFEAMECGQHCLGRSWFRCEDFQITRSDYGTSPYLRLLSRLGRTVPKVRIDLWVGRLDDYQKSRRFDQTLMKNWLRRRIEDSDEARALQDFPGCDRMSYDECFPRLSDAAAEQEEPLLEASALVLPLCFEDMGLTIEEFHDPRLRLVDDSNILCPFERLSRE